MCDNQIKVINTKRLLRKLAGLALLLSVFQLFVVDRYETFSPLPSNTIAALKDASRASLVADGEPVNFVLSFSLKVDLGEDLNQLLKTHLGISK